MALGGVQPQRRLAAPVADADGIGADPCSFMAIDRARRTHQIRPMSRVTFRGRTLSTAELAALRREIESFDNIDVVADEMRELIEQAFPDLIDRLPPRLKS
jgi:hypothetical protein